MNSNGIVDVMRRKEIVSQSAPERHTTLRSAAQSLSLRNVDQAAVELMAEAINRLTVLVYETGDDGVACNVDVRGGGRLLVPAPWGRGGHKKWGLTTSEANVLRSMMMARQKKGNALPLFAYDGMRKCWYLNIFDYADYNAAIAYLTRCPLTIQEYRGARDYYLGKV